MIVLHDNPSTDLSHIQAIAEIEEGFGLFDYVPTCTVASKKTILLFGMVLEQAILMDKSSIETYGLDGGTNMWEIFIATLISPWVGLFVAYEQYRRNTAYRCCDNQQNDVPHPWTGYRRLSDEQRLINRAERRRRNRRQ